MRLNVSMNDVETVHLLKSMAKLLRYRLDIAFVTDELPVPG